MFAVLTYRQVGRLDVHLHGAPAGATTYLLVGTDTRADSAPPTNEASVPRARCPANGLTSSWSCRCPTTDDRRVASIPRDLGVVDDEGSPTRLALTYEHGPQHLVDTLCRSLGIGVDRLVVTRFAGFADLVDTIGGIDLVLAAPFRDTVSGSNLPQGRVHLDGAAALAYVRARHAEILTGYGWLHEPDSALRRGDRAREVLRAIVSEVPSATDPLGTPEPPGPAQERSRWTTGNTWESSANFPVPCREMDRAREITIPVRLIDGPVPLASLTKAARQRPPSTDRAAQRRRLCDECPSLRFQ